MRISFAGMAGRLPPGPLRDRIGRAAAWADDIAGGTDDRSVSRRIALIAFAIRIVSAVIAYASQILLARWMGDFQYGVFVVVWVGAIVLGGLSCLGFQKAIVRFVPEYSEKGESDLLRGVLLGSRLQVLATATAAAALGMLGLHAFGDAIAGHYVAPLYLAAVSLPMLALTEVQEGVSRAYNWADLALWPAFIIRPILILLFMAGALAAGFRADAVTAMAAVIAASYLSAVWQTIVLHSRLRKVVPGGVRAYRSLTWVGIALPIFLVEGFFNLMTNVDIIIVGQFMPPDKVAVYYAAVKTLALVHFVYFSVRAGAAHRFSQYYAAGDRNRLEALVRDTLHWTFWPSLGMGLLILLLGRPLLALYGPSFVAGYPLLWICMIGLVFRAAVGPAESLLSMAGQQRACAAVYFASFTISVAGNFVLIPRMGLAGAATATSVALFVEALSLFLVARARLGINCAIPFAIRPPRRLAEAG